MQPDILADIQFYQTKDGGRQGPTPPDKFGCLLEISGKYYDCRLVLDKIGALSPGQSATVPIKFLSPEAVLEQLKFTPQFHLWDGKRIAEGKLKEIFVT